MAVREMHPRERPLDLWQAFRGFSRATQLFLLFTAVNGVTVGIYALCFNLYASALGNTNAQIGLLNAVPTIGMFAIGLPGGFLADRFGYKPFVVASTILMGIAPLALLVAPRGAGIIIFVLVFGAGNALIWVVSGPLLAAFSTQANRVHLFSLNAFALTVSIAVGNLLGGALPEWWAHVRHVSANGPAALQTSFFAMFVLGLLTLGLALIITPPPPAARATDVTTATAMPDTSGGKGLFFKLIAPSAIIGLGAGAFLTFQQLYFHQRFTLTPGPIAGIFAISQVVTAGAILLAPWLADHLGRVRAAVVTEAMSIPFLLLLAFTHQFALALAAFYMRAALMNMGGPVAEALAMDLLPVRQRATYTSLMNALGNLGRGGLGPAISGALQVLGGYGAAFSFTALSYALAAGMYFVFFRHAEPDRHIFGWIATARARRVGLRT